EHLIPVRYGRMLPSPFTFYRGSAAAMAFDLGNAPNTGLRVQLCGDCHILNFGGYATPERRFRFDIVDFDETTPGPFEWDVKRLAASIHVAGRGLGIREAGCEDAASAMARAYRLHMADFSQMGALEVWYAGIDLMKILDCAPDCAARKRYEK